MKWKESSYVILKLSVGLGGGIDAGAYIGSVKQRRDPDNTHAHTHTHSCVHISTCTHAQGRRMFI